MPACFVGAPLARLNRSGIENDSLAYRQQSRSACRNRVFAVTDVNGVYRY